MKKIMPVNGELVQKDNIIFLDIDGVLNQCQPNCYIDTSCLEVLVEICEKLEAKIVLSSSWRVGFSLLGKCSPAIQNLVDLLKQHNIEIIGRTPKRANREIEIKEYLRTHEVNKYLIIDDDVCEFGGTRPDNLMLTNYKTGLLRSDVRLASKIFRGGKKNA